MTNHHSRRVQDELDEPNSGSMNSRTNSIYSISKRCSQRIAGRPNQATHGSMQGKKAKSRGIVGVATTKSSDGLSSTSPYNGKNRKPGFGHQQQRKKYHRARGSRGGGARRARRLQREAAEAEARENEDINQENHKLKSEKCLSNVEARIVHEVNGFVHEKTRKSVVGFQFQYHQGSKQQTNGRRDDRQRETRNTNDQLGITGNGYLDMSCQSRFSADHRLGAAAGCAGNKKGKISVPDLQPSSSFSSNSTASDATFESNLAPHHEGNVYSGGGPTELNRTDFVDLEMPCSADSRRHAVATRAPPMKESNLPYSPPENQSEEHFSNMLSSGARIHTSFVSNGTRTDKTNSHLLYCRQEQYQHENGFAPQKCSSQATFHGDPAWNRHGGNGRYGVLPTLLPTRGSQPLMYGCHGINAGTGYMPEALVPNDILSSEQDQIFYNTCEFHSLRESNGASTCKTKGPSLVPKSATATQVSTRSPVACASTASGVAPDSHSLGGSSVMERIQKQRFMLSEGGSLFDISPRSFLTGQRSNKKQRINRNDF